jgi:electron transfer flavoprotein beta subunit
LKVAVLAKEVPDLEAAVKVVDGGKALDIEKRRVLNFFDEIAVEAALKLKEGNDAEAYAVSAGAGWGIEALRRALAMGIPTAYLIDDPAIDGADSLTVARALAAFVAQEGFDLIIAGRQATDDEAGLVGPMVAELLGIPYVVGIVGLEAGEGAVTVTRETEAGRETLRMPLPALVTAEKGLFEPRMPAVIGVMKAMKAQIERKSLADLGVEAKEALPVAGYSPPPKRGGVKMIAGEPAEQAKELVRLLKEEAKVL